MDATMKIGPAGSEGGKIWDHKGRSQLVQIFVSFGPKYINSLRFQYVENGCLVTSEIIGRQHFSDVTNFETLTLDYPSEYITTVKGHYIKDNNNTNTYIDKLTIMTNTRVDGKEFGTGGSYYYPNESSSFTFSFGKLNQFGGFHGAHNDKGVMSIGVYVSPIMALPGRPMKCKHCELTTTSIDEDDTQSVRVQGM